MDIQELLRRAERDCRPVFESLEALELENTRRVLDALHAEDIAARHFAPTTGYGYDDIGRDALERVFARLFGCESAIVRPSIACGTAALSLCLFGLLRPGEHLLSATGTPYDTMETVIGLRGDAVGSLKEMGVEYSQVELKENLHITVADNGCGIPTQKLAEIRQQLLTYDPARQSHIGVANVNQRIQLYYGTAYGITIESEDGRGTQVMLTLPRRSDGEGRTIYGGAEDFPADFSGSAGCLQCGCADRLQGRQHRTDGRSTDAAGVLQYGRHQ